MPSLSMPCIVCQKPITADFDSEEHAFSNAVGGWLKVEDFLCRPCNSEAGETWDAELAKQMHPLCTLFGVVRERGATPPLRTVTTAGEALTIQNDGALTLTKPEFSKTKVDEGTLINFKARDEREARRMLEGLKGEFPNLDVEALLAKSQRVAEPAKGVFHHKLQFGGAEGGRSMVKTAAAFARHLGVPTTACDLAGEYLRNPKAFVPFGYYTTSDLILNRPEGMPLHCVAVSGDPQSGLLLGYVEYFGVVRVVTALSQSYTGPAVQGIYAIDPRTANLLNLEIVLPLPFTKDDMAAIYDYKHMDLAKQKAAFEAVIGPAMERNRARAAQREAEQDT